MNLENFKRSNDKQFLGVAAGVAEYFDLDVTIVRLLFILFTLMGGPGFIAYFILALIMPRADSGSSPYTKTVT